MSYEMKSNFAGFINNMLEYRLAHGQSTVKYAEDLANFDRFCLCSFPDAIALTKELAFSWCNNARKNSGCRVPVIRGFGKYLASIGENAYIMPSSFFSSKKAELPYILTEIELANFFDASDRIAKCRNSPLLEYTVPVIFRLQYACGLRPREARTVRKIDFNFKDNTIYINDTKHHKDRRLPVSSEIMELCRKYNAIADIVIPERTFFFQSPSGCAYKKGWLAGMFRQCWEASGNGNARGACTPYDLRHNFATQTLMRWVEEGKDVNAWMPYLSTYMGHSCFSSTYYYIHLLPERLSKMDFTFADGIIPEVEYEE